MNVYNAAGDCTFTTDPGGVGVSFASWASVVAILPRGSSYTGGADPRGQLLYQSTAAEWDQIYVILNNHQFRHLCAVGKDAEAPGGPLNHELNLVNRSYYFDATNYRIYAGAYSFNSTQEYSTTWGATSWSWGGVTGTTVNTTYVVLRAFQG